MTEIKKITITTESGRIDKVLTQLLPDYSRSQIQQWLKKDLVQINDQPCKSNRKVVTGDVITIAIPEPMTLDLTPEDIPLDIVYEDDQVLVVNKPQGMVVHPSAGHPNGTLVNALLAHTPLSEINGVFRPGIVHRIDKDTSGLLMVAKTNAAHESLSAQLKAKENLREYIALVHGTIEEDEGTIDAPIGRSKVDRMKQAIVNDGRPAVTHFTVIERFTDFTLIKCRLETGRTHQIRVHLAYINRPVAGDPVYGPRKTLPGNGQFLHAAVLGFKHPTTGEMMRFEAPLPPIFAKTLHQLRDQH
ncbi:RluA family pseudouridine synthase [Latilactobacillus graminis]|uniref:Pseudouridine synthase n=2 Tax=Latilactobacillus graminis TaxID=60519 RepID=A0AA89L3U0_9LACO|nr:RluA family pseudouridine synthase [Latilactobacillus graminis]KRM22208.1 pseudouridine synthase, RluA family protein [Latilactobacillus graminis DSM 20719]QFP79614.1 RluA family pseudouridine synthase [Latilactobacillus graminis]